MHGLLEFATLEFALIESLTATKDLALEKQALVLTLMIVKASLKYWGEMQRAARAEVRTVVDIGKMWSKQKKQLKLWISRRRE